MHRRALLESLALPLPNQWRVAKLDVCPREHRGRNGLYQEVPHLLADAVSDRTDPRVAPRKVHDAARAPGAHMLVPPQGALNVDRACQYVAKRHGIFERLRGALARVR